MSAERPHAWIDHSDGRFRLHADGSSKPLHADPAVLDALKIAMAIDRLAQEALKALDNSNRSQCAACGNTCPVCAEVTP